MAISKWTIETRVGSTDVRYANGDVRVDDDALIGEGLQHVETATVTGESYVPNAGPVGNPPGFAHEQRIAGRLAEVVSESREETLRKLRNARRRDRRRAQREAE